MTTKEQKLAIADAVKQALSEIGIVGLRSTPLFLSNSRRAILKAA